MVYLLGETMEEGCEGHMFHINFLVDKKKLAKIINNRQEEIDKEMKRKQLEAKLEQQREKECHLTELRLRQEEWTRTYVAGDN